MKLLKIFDLSPVDGHTWLLCVKMWSVLHRIL